MPPQKKRCVKKMLQMEAMTVSFDDAPEFVSDFL